MNTVLKVYKDNGGCGITVTMTLNTLSDTYSKLLMVHI
jgi:hypothetical protein